MNEFSTLTRVFVIGDFDNLSWRQWNKQPWSFQAIFTA